MWVSSIWNEWKINHLLYIDELKLIGRSKGELINEITIVKTFSNNIKVKSGLKKCVRIFKKWYYL
jgi:hypothetical protein